MADVEETGETVEEQAEQTQETTTDALTVTDVQKMIQSEVDKVRTKYVQESKDKDTEIEALKKASMDAKQLAEYERTQREEQVADREKRVEMSEHKLMVTQALANAKLPPSVATLMTAPKDAEGMGVWIEALLSIVNGVASTKVNQTLVGAGNGATQSGKSVEGQKTLETREDGMKATEEQFLADLERLAAE